MLHAAAMTVTIESAPLVEEEEAGSPKAASEEAVDASEHEGVVTEASQPEAEVEEEGADMTRPEHDTSDVEPADAAEVPDASEEVAASGRRVSGSGDQADAEAVSESAAEELQAPAGDAASTEAASTEAASTEAASTEAASTEAASTEAASTEAASTEAASGPEKAAEEPVAEEQAVEEPVAEEPAPRASKRRGRKSSRKEAKAQEPEPAAATEEPSHEESAEDSAHEELAPAHEDPSVVATADVSEPEPASFVSQFGTAEVVRSEGDLALESTAGVPVESDALSVADLEIDPTAAPTTPEELEPATSMLTMFGADGTDAGPMSGFPESEALAGLADSLQPEPAVGENAEGEDTEGTADLVAEAVASFQEQHGAESYFADFVAGGGPTTAYPSLAKALMDGQRVSTEDMDDVLEEHNRTGQSIARILTARNLVGEADLMWGMAQEMGLDFVDLDTAGVDLAQASLIPEATARHHNVVVIGTDEGTPIVAASNPTDVFAMDDLRTIIGRNFIVVVATRSQISSYINRVFNTGDAADMAMEASLGFDGTTEDSGVDDIQVFTEEAPIVRYVNLLILQALNERASDIHVEPTGGQLRIRYRIDGVLHDVSNAPRAIAAAVTTRLKVMADMNVAEHRIPQDGRISLKVGSKGIDLRMATLPTIHGEKVVMRVLDKSSVVLGFSDLGFADQLLTVYEGIYTKPYGTILVTGPTGSGKSTTLYTTLTALEFPREEHHHGGRPGRAPAQGRQPDAVERQGRSHLRVGPQVDPAFRPGHRPGR